MNGKAKALTRSFYCTPLVMQLTRTGSIIESSKKCAKVIKGNIFKDQHGKSHERDFFKGYKPDLYKKHPFCQKMCLENE